MINILELFESMRKELREITDIKRMTFEVNQQSKTLETSIEICVWYVDPNDKEEKVIIAHGECEDSIIDQVGYVRMELKAKLKKVRKWL